MKYKQSAIATTNLYDSVPGASREPLRGFYSAKRERTWTSNVRPSNEFNSPLAMPIGHDARKSFLLAKSHVPLKRDKVRKVIKCR